MITGLTVSDVAEFSGRAESSYTSFINQAILQSCLLIEIAGGITAWPASTTEYLLVKNGILEMADHIYLSQPWDIINASPLVSETIGSRSYSKSSYGKFLNKLKAGEPTGVFWFDLAILKVGTPVQTVEEGSITHVFDGYYEYTPTGEKVYLGPADLDLNEGIEGSAYYDREAP